MGKIKVLLWDVDGTLLNFQEAEKHAIRACFSQFGLGECTDAMLEEYSAINQKYWQRLERGEIGKPQVLEGRFLEFFSNHGIDGAVAAPFNREYQLRLGDTVCFHDNAGDLVASLRGRVRQYAVTNGTKAAQDRKLARSGLAALLDGVFISDEMGVEKPHPDFFRQVFRRIGPLEKAETMIVGDSLTSDIQGGNNAGILCCWYNPGGLPRQPGLRIDYEITSLKELPAILEIGQAI